MRTFNGLECDLCKKQLVLMPARLALIRTWDGRTSNDKEVRDRAKRKRGWTRVKSGGWFDVCKECSK